MNKFHTLIADPSVRKLVLEMEKLGCPLSKSFFKCGNCKADSTGYFSTDDGVSQIDIKILLKVVYKFDINFIIQFFLILLTPAIFAFRDLIIQR